MLTKEIFDKIWTSNPNGGGIGYWRGPEPIILVTMDKTVGWNNYLHAFEELMNPSERFKHQPKYLVLHCRIKTHGTIALSNNHPFFAPIEDGMICGHNGCTCHAGVVAPKDWSDTRTLVESWIPENTSLLTEREGDRKLLQKELGSSKFCGITRNAKLLINFPEHGPDDLKQYGRFSNFGFNYNVTRSSPSRSTGYVGSSFSIFKEDPDQYNRDVARLQSDNGKISWASPSMIARGITYALENNLSFAATLVMFHSILDDFPTCQQLKEAVSKYGDTIQSMSDFHDNPVPATWEELMDQPLYDKSDDLSNAFLDAEGVDEELEEDNETATVADPPAKTQEELELERAGSGEQVGESPPKKRFVTMGHHLIEVPRNGATRAELELFNQKLLEARREIEKEQENRKDGLMAEEEGKSPFPDYEGNEDDEEERILQEHERAVLGYGEQYVGETHERD